MNEKRKGSYKRTEHRKLTTSIGMSVDAWVVLDLLSEEDKLSIGQVVEKLINDEAGRRLKKRS